MVRPATLITLSTNDRWRTSEDRTMLKRKYKNNQTQTCKRQVRRLCAMMLFHNLSLVTTNPSYPTKDTGDHQSEMYRTRHKHRPACHHPLHFTRDVMPADGGFGAGGRAGLRVSRAKNRKLQPKFLYIFKKHTLLPSQILSDTTKYNYPKFPPNFWCCICREYAN